MFISPWNHRSSLSSLTLTYFVYSSPRVISHSNHVDCTSSRRSDTGASGRVTTRRSSSRRSISDGAGKGLPQHVPTARVITPPFNLAPQCHPSRVYFVRPERVSCGWCRLLSKLPMPQHRLPPGGLYPTHGESNPTYE